MDRLRSKSYEEREFHVKGGDDGGMKSGGSSEKEACNESG